MPTIITLAHEVSAATESRIRALLDETALRDEDWNGAVFAITRDDYTQITGSDSGSEDAATLFSNIQRIIQGDE